MHHVAGCPFCRRVREVATHLDLEYTVVPCGQKSRHRDYVKKASSALGKTSPTFPYFEDDAEGVKMFESEDIISHLLTKYGNGAGLPEPVDYFLPSTFVTGWIPALLRFGKGSSVVDSVVEEPSQPLVLYNYGERERGIVVVYVLPLSHAPRRRKSILQAGTGGAGGT